MIVDPANLPEGALFAAENRNPSAPPYPTFVWRKIRNLDDVDNNVLAEPIVRAGFLAHPDHAAPQKVSYRPGKDRYVTCSDADLIPIPKSTFWP